MIKYLFGALLVLVFVNSIISHDSREDKSLIPIPIGFSEINFSEDNLPSIDRIRLGKRLFFDTLMSKDFSVSCASCHKPHLAFSDNLQFSIGSDLAEGKSNAPTLTNVAYSPYLNRDGGVSTIEMQVLVPIQEHLEFDMNILEIAERMNEDASYKDMSMLAYDRIPDPYVIVRALASFERTLISGHSRFDQYYYQYDKKQLTKEERKGMELFFGDRAQCSSCHGGFTFTNYAFENNGLYEQYADSGRMRITGEESDRGLFKVPALRNLEYTSPYMHDGSMETIEEVIEHYSSGITTHKNLSKKLKPFHFTKKEKAELVAFLKCLSDEEFIEKNSIR